MANEVVSLGVKLGYCVETTAGTRPSTSYTNLPGITSVPSFDPQPENIETTTLNETEYRTYVQGLKGVENAEFGYYLSQDFVTAYNTMYSAYETAKASNKGMWFVIHFPTTSGFNKDFFFRGQPSKLGLPGIEVNSVISGNFTITPEQIHGYDTQITIS